MKKAVKKSIARKGHKAVKEAVSKSKQRRVEVLKATKKVKVKDETPEEVQLEAVKSETTLPVFEGSKVLFILEDGHTKTHYKCACKDRNGNFLTIHVPKSIF